MTITKNHPEIISCPDWASVMIDQLRQLEVHLGNIPEHLAWKSQMVGSLNEGVFGEGTQITDEHTELVFAQICCRLTQEGFASAKIVDILNSRIGFEGGPAYCDIDEVEAASD